MADAKQVQIRRDTSANLATTTPVEAELGYDQTNKRLLVGDGTTAAGIPHVNYLDARGMTFNRGTIGGTANAIILTLSPVATSYFIGMSLRIIAAATNSGPTTINVNGIANRDIYKVSGTSIVPLSGAEIVNGGVYDLVYDGTRFILFNVAPSNSSVIGQSGLSTSTGTFSGSSFYTSGPSVVLVRGDPITLPGGQYGFYINTYNPSGVSTPYGFVAATQNIGGYVAQVCPVAFAGGGSPISYGLQRYITASPPYNMGDGEVAGFFFVLVNSDGNIVSHYAADTPPWAYNGPTDIRCSRICPVSGKKYIRTSKLRSFEEMMDGSIVKYKEEIITDKIKNADMSLIPHPFQGHKEEYKVVMLDPMDPKIRRIIEYQNAGGSAEFMDELAASKFEVDNEFCKRCGPKSVAIHKMKYKYSGKF